MVQGEVDRLVGTTRDAVLISPEDAESRSLRNGDAVVLRNDKAEPRGRALIAPVSPGNLHYHALAYACRGWIRITEDERRLSTREGKHVFI